VTHASSALKMVAYYPDHAGADHRQAARQALQLDHLVAVRHGGAVEGMWGGRSGRVPTATTTRAASTNRVSPASACTSIRCGSRNRARPRSRPTRLRANWCSSVFDLVLERLVQADHEVAGLDVPSHPVGQAVEAALPPAGQVEHGLAQRLGGDGAGVHGHAADAPPLRGHQDRPAQLRRLHRRPPPGRAVADDDQIECLHAGVLASLARVHGLT
jgi:hypothetical protein